MEEKLKEILDSNLIRVDTYTKEEEKLLSQIDFYSTHNLNEEKRIALIRHEALSKVLYRYKAMVEEVRELLNAWNS